MTFEQRSVVVTVALLAGSVGMLIGTWAGLR